MARLSVFTLLLAVGAAVGCASGTAGAPPATAEPEPEAVDPVGTYSFETTYQGQTVTGRIVITKTGESFGGVLEPDAGPPPVDIYRVTVDGQEMTVIGDAGGEDLVITMTFTGDTYTGSWVLGFDSGELKGERIKR
ncbi:MAG: hypothetical protein GTN62_13355 [Gemmatimonadales bacterium]|nr:hypothetical protein [Gemmatimonadales bacterium]NIN12998.1 hypothetical protein [Gemmatimonadales bacterium]NIN51075.1 hypothetical protein [Gemmatimonadales bacterium]NIP08539.1 hypothetical protein [Gemmatimonadales bacterium]NIR02257.1 hypothetical protein [Gemmatimonadales bacterium]